MKRKENPSTIATTIIEENHTKHLKTNKVTFCNEILKQFKRLNVKRNDNSFIPQHYKPETESMPSFNLKDHLFELFHYKFPEPSYGVFNNFKTEIFEMSLNFIPIKKGYNEWNILRQVEDSVVLFTGSDTFRPANTFARNKIKSNKIFIFTKNNEPPLIVKNDNDNNGIDFYIYFLPKLKNNTEKVLFSEFLKGIEEYKCPLSEDLLFEIKRLKGIPFYRQRRSNNGDPSITPLPIHAFCDVRYPKYQKYKSSILGLEEFVFKKEYYTETYYKSYQCFKLKNRRPGAPIYELNIIQNKNSEEDTQILIVQNQLEEENGYCDIYIKSNNDNEYRGPFSNLEVMKDIIVIEDPCEVKNKNPKIFEILPFEIVEHITSFMNLKEIVKKFSLISKKVFELSRSKMIWWTKINQLYNLQLMNGEKEPKVDQMNMNWIKIFMNFKEFYKNGINLKELSHCPVCHFEKEYKEDEEEEEEEKTSLFEEDKKIKCKNCDIYIFGNYSKCVQCELMKQNVTEQCSFCSSYSNLCEDCAKEGSFTYCNGCEANICVDEHAYRDKYDVCFCMNCIQDEETSDKESEEEE
ncbi:hypothetical protein ABK040_015336 [Willaertia magna]